MKKTKLHFICGVASLLALTLTMTSCNKTPSSDGPNGRSAACSNNPYLMKYNCSIERIQQAAEEGNPDAQYGLGYMYYYGIDTVKDRPTAELWIQRAAAQGQPLAKKAWSLINSGATFTDLHQAASGQKPPSSSSQVPTGSDMIEQQEAADVSKMNATKPTQPLSSELPAYQHQSLSQATPASTSAPAANLTPAHANLAQLDKHSFHDPRLASNAQPIVAKSTPVAAAAAPAQAVAVQASDSSAIAPVANAINTQVAQQESGYTVQLMASDQLSDIKAFAAAHNLADGAHYYQTALNGKPWYMLTYGRYATAQEAKLALQALPKSDDANHPWVKSFATVEKEVALKKVVA